MEEVEENKQPSIEEIKEVVDKKRKQVRKPSKYNEFVKEEMVKLKDDNISHQERFKTISKKWKDLKEPLPDPVLFIRKPRKQEEEPIIIKQEEKVQGLTIEELQENINSMKELLQNALIKKKT